MAEDEAADAVSSAAQTLSQLLARILNQLSISAWLPAAALVLAVTFLLELGAVLDVATHSVGPGQAMGSAFHAISKISGAGISLLVASIVVVTMLTQAFSFESIRLAEGYWGKNRAVERLAQARTKHFGNSKGRLQKRREVLRDKAWRGAAEALKSVRMPPSRSGQIVYSDAVVEAIGRGARGGSPLAEGLTDKDYDLIDATMWEDFAPVELLRRIQNIDLRLADFPERHIMPTKLGNALRRFEDDTGHPHVESMVNDVFDRLPSGLQVAHDEYRGRLDLYCSMIIVIWVAAIIGAVRFGWEHRGYGAAALGFGFVGSWIAYRASVASVRLYGSLLLTIARFALPGDKAAQTEPGLATGS